MDFFRGCLAKSRGSSPAEQRLWREGIYDQIREVMPMQGQLSIERMCYLAQVSRAGFYRSMAEKMPAEEEHGSACSHSENCHRAQAPLRLSKNHRRTAPPRNAGQSQTRGADHARRQSAGDSAARLRRDNGLLITSLEVYLNLAGRMKLTGINQLWVADITYIRLQREFVYLAVILDAFSRRVVGWALDSTLAARLTIAALEKAVAERQPPPGLVHHSDRGLQYASSGYVAILRNHYILPSMSRPANPYDNASCESFMKTLKHEEIYANDYRDHDHLRANIEDFIERYYNSRRLHSALGYRPPEEFEQAIAVARAAIHGATMSFFRHQEIFRSDVQFFD